MTRTRALLWKEYREHMPFLLAGSAVFLGVTLLTAACAYFVPPPRSGKFYSEMGVAMVVLFGPALAIFLAAGASCRDLTEPVCDFWRSRPISPRQLVLRKYAAGVTTLLLIVFGTFLLVVLMAWGAFGNSRWHTGATAISVYYTLALILIYSVSFLLGCLVRRTAQAAMVAAVAVLMLYFLPLVFPPLERVGIVNLLMRSDMGYGLRGPPIATWLRLSIAREAPFTALVLVGCAASVVLSVKAVTQGWRLHVGKRFICWAFVAVGLILWAATAFPLATNLDCLYRQPVLPGMPARKGGVAEISSEGNQGALLQWGRREYGVEPCFEFSARRFELGPEGFKMGPGVVVGTSNGPVYSSLSMPRIAWSAAHPERAFVLHADVEYDRRISRHYNSLQLQTVAFDAGEHGAIVHTIDLLEHLPAAVGKRTLTRMYLSEGSLVIRAGSRLIVVDVRDPQMPTVSRVFEKEEVSFERDGETNKLNALDYRVTSVAMLPVEGMPLRERMEASVHLCFGDRFAIEDDIVVLVASDRLTTYRVAEYDQTTVRLERLGRRRATPVERMINTGMGPKRTALRDGLAYVLGWNPSVGLTVYDVRDPARPRRIRHYAAPNEGFFDLAALPDGRVLLGGTDLHVIEAALEDPQER